MWLGIGELLARQAIDLKYYGADSEVGYFLKPNQDGGSLAVGSYAVNEKGLGVAQPFGVSDKYDVLLVGDSIVLGTSTIDQPERVGPQIERLTGWEVWPLSAGSWALWNELRMIERQPELRRVDAIVFVLNAEDFAQPSFWDSEYTHPRSEPSSYLLYGIRKKFRGLQGIPQPLAVRQSDLQSDWKEFRASTPLPIYVIGYNGLKTSGSECKWLPEWLDVPTSCFDAAPNGDRRQLVDPMHLTASGNTLLAEFIRGFVAAQRARAPDA